MALQRRTRSTRMLVITLVTASLVTITIDYKQGSSGPLAEIGKAALSVVSPMQEGISKAFTPVSHFFSAIAEAPSLRSKNADLRTRIQELESQLSTVTSLEYKVQQFEQLFGINQTLLSDFETKGADVISSGVSNFEWSITIDKGSSDGVKVNDAVLAASGLVGHVVVVTPNQSKVELMIDPSSSVSSRLVVSRETGIIDGRGNEDPTMALIDAETSVQPNEGVETAGYDKGVYPPGIPMGTVASIDATAGALTTSITIHPYVDFSTLDIVLVVLGPRSR